MAKNLTGIVMNSGKLIAHFNVTAFGATKVGTKEASLSAAVPGAWAEPVRTAAAAHLAACQAEADAAELNSTIVQVQLYTAINDPGYPPFSMPGEVIDVMFQPGTAPGSMRIGDDEVVPEAIATTRDALKAAVQAAL